VEYAEHLLLVAEKMLEQVDLVVEVQEVL